MYWGDLWRLAGRPTTGLVHEAYKQARKEYHLAILRVKKRRKEYQAQRLIVAAMEGDAELIREMKTIRKGKTASSCELPDNVAGAVGEENIAELFRASYEELYNSAPTGNEIQATRAAVEGMISQASKVETDRLTGDVVKDAVARLKSGKTDVNGSYVSDALKNAPDLFYKQLASVFRSWM